MNDSAQSRYVRDCLRYLRHQKGLTLFWVWLERWIAMEGWIYDKERGAFCLSPNASPRFLFGAPRPGFGASGKPVFVGVQPEEEAWLSRMLPSRVVFDGQPATGPRMLWMIFSGMTSPDQAWPDLPPLVLGIEVYPDQLLKWSGDRMDVRSVWWEDNGNEAVAAVDAAPTASPRVAAVPLATLPVQHGDLMSGWNPDEIFVKTLRQRALEKAEAELEMRGLDHDPGYQGPAPMLDSSQRQLVDPFAAGRVEIIEENYRGLFGQFIDGVEAGPRRRGS